MLIPYEDGSWSWDDGPRCKTKDEALATAAVAVSDSVKRVYTVDMSESMTIEDDNKAD